MHRLSKGISLSIQRGEIPTLLLLFAVVILLCIAVVPFFFCLLPPLGDYQPHLAITYILAEYTRTAPFQKAYVLDWGIYPNLAMDIVVPPLVAVLDIKVAGLVFIFLTFFLIVCGALLVNKTLYGRVSIGAFLVFCLLYNGILDWGFMNYLFGLGMAMVAFGVYVMLHNHKTLLRIVVSSLLAIIVFVCHLYPFLIYGILVIFYEIGDFFQNRVDRVVRGIRRLFGNLIIAGVQAITPIIFFVFFSPTSSTDVVSGISFGSFRRKLEALYYLFGNYNEGIDLICYVSISVFVGFMIGRRRIIIAKPMLAAIVFLCCVFLIMPAVVFTSSSADRRLIVAIGLVAVSAVQISTRSWRELTAAAVVIVFVFLLQVGMAQHSWAAYNARLKNYLTAFQSVEKGSNVAVAVDPNASWFPIGIRAVVSLLVLERDAFPSQQFLWPGQNPIRLTESYKKMAQAAPREELYEHLVAIYESRNHEELDKMIQGSLSGFQYLLVIHESEITARLTTLGLQRIAYGSDFDLYRLR